MKNKRQMRTQRRDELKQVNIATIVLKYNLEILIHFAHQIILPHYRDTAYNAGSNVGPSKEEIDKFVQTLNKYQHMMMKASILNFVDYDFLSKLTFAVDDEPELLGKANWLKNLFVVLQTTLRERNAHIESAASVQDKGAKVHAILNAIQFQLSIANAECVTVLQAIEQIPIMAQILERIGRSYQDAGKPKRLIPPQAMHDAIKQLRAIVDPYIETMGDGRSRTPS